MQADASSGFNRLYDATRRPSQRGLGTTTGTLCRQILAFEARAPLAISLAWITWRSPPSVLGTPGPIAGAGLVPLPGLAGAYLFGRKRLAA